LIYNLVLRIKIFIMIKHTTKVSTYSGYKADERPLCFTIGDQRLEVRHIISRWVEPEKDFFRVIAEDQKIYTISRHRKSDLWSVEKISEKR
jgi:hypothetical protein